MDATEATLRAIKDRVAGVMGELDETASDARSKDNYHRLNQAARELHRCADEMQNILMRMKPR